MAAKHSQEIENQDPEVVIESAINSTEEFIFKNGKKLIALLAAIILVVGGYFAYKYAYQAPREKAAADMMFAAEQYFAEGNWDKALNGEGDKAGLLAVIEKYNSPLAKHYAGICYLKAEDLDNALAMLKGYKPTKGVPNELISAQNFGLQGDVLSQKQDYSAAISLYQKAIDASDNNFTAPVYLYKQALVYMEIGQNDKALAAAKRIADDYAQSLEARDIQKLIGQLEQK